MRDYSVAYEYKNSLYLNITNKCPNLCSFCIKTKWDMKYRGYSLKLDEEPDLNEIITEIEKFCGIKKYNELVFCGYGEPTMRWNLIKNICSEIRKSSVKGVNAEQRIRINTNGLGNLINKRDITSEMKGLINSLNISLNTMEPSQWLEIMRPFKGYEKGFYSVIDFIKKARKNVDEVVVTAVDLKEVDIQKVKEFALRSGVKFKLRRLLEYEND